MPIAMGLRSRLALAANQASKENISLDIDARGELISIRGGLWFKGQRFDIRSGKIEFNGGTPELPIVKAGVSELCFVGG